MFWGLLQACDVWPFFNIPTLGEEHAKNKKALLGVSFLKLFCHCWFKKKTRWFKKKNTEQGFECVIPQVLYSIYLS